MEPNSQIVLQQGCHCQWKTVRRAEGGVAYQMGGKPLRGSHTKHVPVCRTRIDCFPIKCSTYYFSAQVLCYAKLYSLNLIPGSVLSDTTSTYVMNSAKQVDE